MIKFEKVPADISRRFPLIIQSLRDDPRVLFAYHFGGLAEGEQKPLSDVDLAIFLAGAEGLAEVKLDLFETISNLLGTAEIDLVLLNTAPVSLAGRIVMNKRVIVDKAPFRRHRYESVTLRKFFDFSKKEETYFSVRYGISG